MRREDLEHVIRAAAEVSGERELVLVGSQAILGARPDAPDELLRSQEAGVYPLYRPERASAIDSALGDGSQFHETFGYYAHGVGPETAKGPADWEERLVPVRVAPKRRAAQEAVGWCMEPHDLVLAKCVAGRERDWEFAAAAIRSEVVDPEELLRRARDLPVSKRDREAISRQLRATIERARPGEG